MPTYTRYVEKKEIPIKKKKIEKEMPPPVKSLPVAPKKNDKPEVKDA